MEKFRIWDNYKKKFITDVVISLSGIVYKSCYYDYFHYDGDGRDVDDYFEKHLTIERFIWLFDENGVEIYENDCVEYYLNGEDKPKKGYVYFDNKLKCWTITKFWCPHYDYPKLAFSEDLKFKVIGNIHDKEKQ